MKTCRPARPGDAHPRPWPVHPGGRPILRRFPPHIVVDPSLLFSLTGSSSAPYRGPYPGVGPRGGEAGTRRSGVTHPRARREDRQGLVCFLGSRLRDSYNHRQRGTQVLWGRLARRGGMRRA